MNPFKAARALAGPQPLAASAYHGAAINRFTSDWLPPLLSADQEIGPGIRLLRSRARDMVRNSPHAAGFVREYGDNVVGVEDGGIRLQARNRVRDARRSTGVTSEFDRDTNAYLEDRWAAWGLPEQCSVDGRESWTDQQKFYARSLLVDGEVLWRELPGYENAFGYAIQFLDPDQLDETYNVLPGPDQNEIRMGVEVDAFLRPVAYHIWRGHPADWRTRRERIRVPATELHHDFVKVRAGQTRGVTHLAAVLIYWRHLEGFTVAEIQQARQAACAGGFLTTKGTDADMWLPPEANLGARTPMEVNLEPNTYKQLPPGVGLETPQPVHPNPNAPAFRKDILRSIARALGPSYTSVSGDFENTNYSSGRMGLLPERDFFRAAARFETMRFHRLVYHGWRRAAWLAGALPAISDPDAVGVHKWEYRGWPWVDPLNDVQAKELMLALKLTSPQKLCAELGVDLEENLEEFAEAERMAASLGLTLTPADVRPTPRQDAPAEPAQKPGAVRRLHLLAEGAP